MMPNVTALIPARGGSRGLPRKNVLPLAGRPLIAWTIDAALQCPLVTSVVVSTDDEEIAAAAREAGARVPFMRPADLSGDESSSIDVAAHAITQLRQAGSEVRWLLFLQPTSPLRTAEDIAGAIDLQQRVSARAVVSVTPAKHPPHWMRRMNTNGVIEPWLEGTSPSRRQEAATLYHVNGAIYLIEAQDLCDARTFLPEHTHGFVMPEERSIDVDDAWDFHLADLVMRDRLANASRLKGMNQ
jgi:CMP-N,N'-diacetyllegionaminic acid synthase